MVVKVEDARIEVEIDVRRALDQTREIESTLERARARKRLGQARIDPGIEGRLGTRRLGAAVAGLGVGRAAAGGLRSAVALAAKVGFGLTLTEIIRTAPSLIPAILDEETLRTQIFPEIDIAGIKIEGVTIDTVVRALGEKIAEIEGTLATTMRGLTLMLDLTAEGRFAEGAAGALKFIQRAIGPSTRKGELTEESAREAGFLGVFEEAGQIFDAFRAYNTAEALFKQRARTARYRELLDNQAQQFRAAGGGVSK